MSQQTRNILCIALACGGLIMALMGLRRNVAANPQPGGSVLLWLGVGITFLASFLIKKQSN